MVTTELLTALRSLDRADKLHVMQVLVSDLAEEENELMTSGQAYPIWSPHDAHEAAATLLKVLELPESKA